MIEILNNKKINTSNNEIIKNCALLKVALKNWQNETVLGRALTEMTNEEKQTIKKNISKANFSEKNNL